MPYNLYLQAELVQQITGSGQMAVVKQASKTQHVNNAQQGSGLCAGKGKRKAAMNPAGESPSKKIAAHHGNNDMEVKDN